MSVLAEEHVDHARRFATRDTERFAGLALHDDTDVPILADAIAYFECRVDECHPGGDHSIFVGRVLSCGHDTAGVPCCISTAASARWNRPSTGCFGRGRRQDRSYDNDTRRLSDPQRPPRGSVAGRQHRVNRACANIS